MAAERQGLDLLGILQIGAGETQEQRADACVEDGDGGAKAEGETTAKSQLA